MLSNQGGDSVPLLVKPSISLIGAGAAGCALLVALSRKGYPVAAISSRTLKSTRHCAELVGVNPTPTDNPTAAAAGDIVIIATPDSLIRPLCEEISGKGGVRQGQLVLHLSGTLTSDALTAAAKRGADTCAMHPIQTLAAPLEGARLLESAWYCLEGTGQGIERARRLAETLSGRVMRIGKSDKALYHAALCVASNYLVVLERVAVEMLAKAGVDPADALPALMPLIRGAADNLSDCGLPDALTGPISRGDTETVMQHLRALEEKCGDYLPLYKELGRQALLIATEKGKMAPGSAAPLLEMLKTRS